jgi:hypothetical protein
MLGDLLLESGWRLGRQPIEELVRSEVKSPADFL